MHMRKKKWSRPELAACPYYIQDPVQLRNTWADRFPRRQPVHLELGCGKGVSTSQMAFANQDVNYIAIDINADVLGCTRRNLQKAYGGQPVENILLTNCHIGFIHTILGPEDPIERIYISFCNPWCARPKQHKRRLTHPRQLMQYRDFLRDGGEVWFKTDDDQLFADSLRYFEACGFDQVFITDDLHGCGFTPNYISEYERKYLQEGLKIHFGIFRKQPGTLTFDPVTWHMWDQDGEPEVLPVVKQYTIKRIVEDDFGCEGLPEGEELQVTLVLQDADGRLRRLRMPDSQAYALGLNEGGCLSLDDDGCIVDE